MTKCDVVIIGSGLFGSMTYRYLTLSGLDAVVIDNNHPMSASKCSFGVWKEGWINKTIQDEVAQGMDLLESFSGGVETLDFYNMKKDKVEQFKRANCNNILLPEKAVVYGNVVGIKKNVVRYNDITNNVQEIQARKKIVVAAGAWTNEILKLAGNGFASLGIDRVWGATMDLKLELDDNRILEWAPYRQSVLVKNGNIYNFGDGATVKNPKDGLDPRLEKASNRLLEHLADIVGTNVSDDRIKAVNEGYRPYLKKGTKSFVNAHGEYLISATGGAKNSTILCGHVAKTVLELF